MPDSVHVFLDFDDTLSDFAALGQRYVGALSTLLAKQFGGVPEVWVEPVGQELAAATARYEATFVGSPLAGYCAWIEQERARIALAILGTHGAALPTGFDAGTFARQMQREALLASNCTFPGAAEALTALESANLPVMMASSQESEYLSAALEGAGLDRFVGSRFGPDLVDCAKEGPEFYRRIFAACGIRASQALVVDDQPTALDWAEEAGARVVQACVKPNAAEPEFPIVLRRLFDLPGLVRMGVV